MWGCGDNPLEGRAAGGHDGDGESPTGVQAWRSSGNSMSSDPEGWAIALRRIAVEAVARTGALDLGALGLMELPEEAYALTHLQELNLGYVSQDEYSAKVQAGQPVINNELEYAQERLATFRELRMLSVSRTDIVDLSWASRLPALKFLDCSYTQVSDLAPLKGHRPPIARLLMHASQRPETDRGADRAPIVRLLQYAGQRPWATQGSDALQYLSCLNTYVSDLAPLKGLAALQVLNCSGTQVIDLAPLEGLAALHANPNRRRDRHRLRAHWIRAFR